MNPIRLLWTITIVMVVGVGLLASCKSARADWAIPAMNKQIDDTNFVVNRGCSGTLIDFQNRLILTAAHCVDDQYETIEREEIREDGEIKKIKRRVLKPGTVSQQFYSGPMKVRTDTYRTFLMKVDKDRDLALLQIMAPISERAAAKISCKEPIRGEKIYLVGNPKGVLYSTVHVGIVSSVQRDERTLGEDNPKVADNGLIQISAGAAPGNSGGAVYNDKGEQVGVLVSGFPSNEMLAFAVPLSDVRTFLGEPLGVACKEK